MKRGLKVQLNFTNKFVYTSIAFAVFVLIGVSVFAFGGSAPATFGHSAGELDLSTGVNGDALFNGNIKAPSITLDDGTNNNFIRGGINSVASIDMRNGGTGHMVFDGDFGYKWNVGANTKMTMDGPGNLDVVGSIKIGFDTRTCDSTLTGSIRYNSGTNNMEFCDATDWTSIGQAGAQSGGGPDFDYTGPLIGGKTGAQCTSEGGVPFNIGSEGHLCQFSRTSCPSGWAQHNDWSATAPNTCSSCVNGCTTQSHVFLNVPIESCSYTGGYITVVLGNNICNPTAPQGCAATTVALGCV
tara:strand:+ start:816 stop:1709 length:894 start_codon:yes stop_codon:yes gene_type:complete